MKELRFSPISRIPGILIVARRSHTGTRFREFQLSLKGESSCRYTNVVTLQPGTVSSTYASPEDFRLTTSNRLLGGGTDVPNAVDFAGNPRGIGSVSVGAFEPRRDPGPITE